MRGRVRVRPLSSARPAVGVRVEVRVGVRVGVTGGLLAIETVVGPISQHCIGCLGRGGGGGKAEGVASMWHERQNKHDGDQYVQLLSTQPSTPCRLH